MIHSPMKDINFKIKYPYLNNKGFIMTISNIKKDLQKQASFKKAQQTSSFFKTTPGSYGYHDIFIGITVPELRSIAKKHKKDISLKNIQTLLTSPIHEERFLALLFMIQCYYQTKKHSLITQSSIIKTYLSYINQINSWDLVDVSSHALLGNDLWKHQEHQKKKTFPLLITLSQSTSLWQRRISIVSTWFFIKKGHLDTTFTIADILLNDSEDLIQKAVGWMLREAGKKNSQQLISFLKDRYQKMPRTMLRYSIEKFPKVLYKKYLNNLI